MGPTPLKCSLVEGKRLDAITIVGNYAVFASSIIVGLVLVPLYVRLMGLENWGIVAWSTALSGVFTILDLGISQVMPRDIAQIEQKPEQLDALYRAYEALYLRLAASGVICILATLPFLLNSWFSTATASNPSGVLLPLSIGVLQAGLQLANMSCLGYFLGAGLQNLSNRRILLFLCAKHIVALGSLIVLGATPLNYLSSMCLVAAVELTANKLKVKHLLRGGTLQPIGKDTYTLRELVKKVKLVAAAVLIGLLVSQSDRLLMTGHLSAADFAQYALVASLGLALIQLQNPIVKAFLRRFALAAQDRNARHGLMKQFVTSVVLLYILPLCLVAAYANEILMLWIPRLSSPAAAETLRLFCLAGVLNSIYQFFYQRSIAEHKIGNVLKVNLISGVAVIIFWANSWGEVAITSGAEMWVLLAATQAAAAAFLEAVAEKTSK